MFNVLQGTLEYVFTRPAIQKICSANEFGLFAWSLPYLNLRKIELIFTLLKVGFFYDVYRLYMSDLIVWV